MPDVTEFEIAKVAALEKQRKEEEKAKKASGEQQEDSSQAAAPSPSPAENGTTSATPASGGEAPIRRLELLRAERLIELYEGDRLIACFPCTPGSRDVPVPDGQWKVTKNVLMPYFRWDKSVLENGVRSDNAYNLPPGPNKPSRGRLDGHQQTQCGHAWNAPTRIRSDETKATAAFECPIERLFLFSELVEKGTIIDVK